MTPKKTSIKKAIVLILAILFLQACNRDKNSVNTPKTTTMAIEQKDLKNETMRTYMFLDEMYNDDYFPDHLVDKGKAILVELCAQVEQQKPGNLEELYALTHSATDRFNELQEEFDENGSEIETAARECIGMDFENIAKAYGFTEADIEELIATRDW